jgi:AcrR family transcriptional regulator
MQSGRRDQNRRAQVERILDAARELFGSRGFETVTMAEIADRAGVARATVFNHFGSKSALVEGITEGVVSVYIAMLDRALALETTATATLVRALFEQMGAGIEVSYGFYRGVFREILRMQIGLDEGGAAARAGIEASARLERLLARGQQRGDITSRFSAAELTCAFESLSNGTITRWLYDDASGSLRERMAVAAEIFLGPVQNGESSDASLPDLLPENPAVIPITQARAGDRAKRRTQ